MNIPNLSIRICGGIFDKQSIQDSINKLQLNTIRPDFWNNTKSAQTTLKEISHFENEIKAKEKHKIDLTEFGVGEIIEETKTTNITSGSGISDEIKELKKLHEEGVLTDDEFEKAKKKVLSQ